MRVDAQATLLAGSPNDACADSSRAASQEVVRPEAIHYDNLWVIGDH